MPKGRRAPGKVSLDVGKTPVKFNIPEAEGVDRLKDLIREHGKWVEPAPQTAKEAVSASPR
jgi:(E)-4-hydroxy-3-methylbut-2-enyl-diphosphate synthase